MSPATPTTVSQSRAPPGRTRFPSGSWPGQKRLAIVLLMITEAGAPSPSLAVKSRPETSGICMVRK